MAVEKFVYMDTGTVPAEHTLTFATAGHLLSDGETYIPNQQSDVTLGGIRLTVNLGTARHQWQVTVIVPETSTATDLADVVGFLGTTGINYGVNSFTWVDYNNTTRSVKLISDSIGIESLGSSWKRVSFMLELVNT